MSFSAKIGTFGKDTIKRIGDIKRAVCIKLFTAVIMDTPVLSGRLRSNWVPSNQDLALTTTDSVDKTGAAALSKMQVVVTANKLEVPIFLSNSLPYAARIEFDGWSHTKAPEGMMRRNVTRFNTLIQLHAKNK